MELSTLKNWCMRMVFALFALTLACPAVAFEAEPDPYGGEVRVPLAAYTAMLNQLGQDPQRAPAAYAIGQSEVAVTIADRDGHKTARVEVAIQIEVFENEWTLVPVLTTGAALRRASIDGSPVQLVERPGGLSWSVNKAGTYAMELAYDADSQGYESGNVLTLPIPRAAATAFNLSFPETGADLSLVPSADLKSTSQDGRTRLTASIPATSTVILSWPAAATRPFVISRAAYSGELQESAVTWVGTFQVEVFGSRRITLPLMPSGVTLSDIRIDGKPATVLEQDGFFATLLQGRGQHQVQVEFQVPVSGDGGPPRASLSIPRIPVSRFDLTLPGNKQVKVAPGADVITTEQDGTTRATAFIPMSDQVVFSWTEAVPAELRGQVRANATLYHAVHAEEGVLHGRANVLYEITHGEANLLELEIPEDAKVNRINAPAGGISDWVVALSDLAGHKRIKVFLERPVSGEYLLELSYEKLLGLGAGDPIGVPLLSAGNVHRQRGMVALLSGTELALEPAAREGVTEVGENQLPAFVRNQIAMTVAHTFKYIEAAPKLQVKAVAPERKQGQFDAQIDSLVSLGDVTMRGSAGVGIDVKSGTIQELRLQVPDNVNVLGVSGPSLRTHEVRGAGDGGQVIELEFTREMDGQFRIEVNYERIMDSQAPESQVPTISVAEAEVEHGRIAIEALTAVEVQATTVERLSSLDINELPQQLLLKTTNPILLAYRYVNAKPPIKLALTITRHQEIDVQVAAIEQAHYKTLVTRDGLAVSTARFLVRNSQRQFLRLSLPPGSEVWSVFVDGKPEKPAYATDKKNADDPVVLIKMVNSARGFPVDIVYATPIQSIDGLGTLSSRLPRPDMVVTNSRWDLFLPVGLRYYALDSTMDLALSGRYVNPRVAGGDVMAGASEAYRAQMGQPLRIVVPTQGIQFAFEKLYANQSHDHAAFSIRYVSAEANHLAMLLSALGAVFLWVGIVALASPRLRLGRRGSAAVILAGMVLLIATLGYLGTSPVPASVLSLLIAVLLALWMGLQRWRTWRSKAVAA